MGLILVPSRSRDARPLTDDDVAAFRSHGLEESLSARWCIGIVLEATEVNLTAGWEDEKDAWIPPERVKSMASALEAADLDRLGREWDSEPAWIDELVRWFRVCADRGLGVNAL